MPGFLQEAAPPAEWTEAFDPVRCAYVMAFSEN
jgi:hypothetical protein